MNKIYAQHTIPVSELKKSPSAVLKDSGGETVAVLTNNKPSFYVVAAGEYEEMISALEMYQRGAADMVSVPGGFKLSRERLAEVSSKSASVGFDAEMEFVECP